MPFDKKEELSPRYVGPYKILKCIGKVTYKLNLLLELATVHPVLDVSMLRKCNGGPSAIVPLDNISVEENLTYEKVLVEILN